ncbi:MAG: hypothetical protein NC084_04115 [Bacteroides sp.]|nr:hypothetical protein [Eubacterium sp.]MCM1417649.1 hypothetical protein [Roseburia sp.]MCM1461886.1 hypothetical protein [Bacteroides sp.]
MKAHISDKEQKLRQAIYDGYDKVRMAAMASAAKAVAGVVLKMAQDETQSESERLRTIVGFCQKSLSLSPKTKAEDQTGEGR